MKSETIYRIGKFEFHVVSRRLRRPDHPEWSKKLGKNEARLLSVLILNQETKTEKDNRELTIAVWGQYNDKGAYDKPFGNLHTCAHKLHEAFRTFEPDEDYLLSNPYSLAKTAELISGISLFDPAQREIPSTLEKKRASLGTGVEVRNPDGQHEQGSEIRERLEDSGGDSHKIAATSDCDLGRCECCGQGLGVIADLRPDRCLVSFGLRNHGWAYERRLSAGLPQQDPQKILSRYLFPLSDHDLNSNERVAIMSGFDYPDDRTFSESGSWVASHYIDAFDKNRIERVENLEDIKRNDALVFLASHQGHPKSREYVGDPRAHSPAHEVKIRPRRSLGYQAELPWAIFTPEDSREICILQTCNNRLLLHKTKEHIISCLDGPPIASHTGKDGANDVWLTDYLLITALPTDGTQQRRVISFIGLHLTGTLAAAKLLRESPPEILDPIHRKLGGHRYFQALISLQVDNTHANQGLARPGRLTGVRVEEITIRKIAKAQRSSK